MSRSGQGGHENDQGDEGKGGVRCGCGALVARLIAGGVELKCRRCRRRILVTFDAGGRVAVDGREVGPSPGPANTNKETG